MIAQAGCVDREVLALAGKIDGTLHSSIPRLQTGECQYEPVPLCTCGDAYLAGCFIVAPSLSALAMTGNRLAEMILSIRVR